MFMAELYIDRVLKSIPPSASLQQVASDLGGADAGDEAIGLEPGVVRTLAVDDGADIAQVSVNDASVLVSIHVCWSQSRIILAAANADGRSNSWYPGGTPDGPARRALMFGRGRARRWTNP
jgi:hypothetical protein